MPPARYEGADALRGFTERSLEQIRSLPGVIDAGVTSVIPFGVGDDNSVIRVVGDEETPGESLVSPSSITVDAGYFETLGIPLLEGRVFDTRDARDARPAIIIDERLARTFWPDGGALGGQMYQNVSLTRDTTIYTVVGVVAEHTRLGLVDVPDPVGAYFFHYPQRPIRSLTFAIRTEPAPQTLINAVRAEVERIDPELPLFFVQTMDERIASRLTSRRTPMVLSLGFAGIALLLSAVGIYGVLAYCVAQRTREFGIRVALGSSSQQLFRLVLTEGAVVLGLGLGAGIAGAFLLRNVVASQLYDVQALDSLVLSAVVVLLSAVMLVAGLVPARRAMLVDPISALNQD